MSSNEPWDPLVEKNYLDELEYARKEAWLTRKKATARSRKIYMTMLFVVLILLFTVIARVAPFSQTFRQEVIFSWEFLIASALFVILIVYRIWSNGFIYDSISFTELDERNRYDHSRSAAGPLAAALAGALEAGRHEAEKVVKTTTGNKVDKVEHSRKAVSGFDFVEHMRSIIESLDYQIDYAEAKASRLLEVGRSFVRGGISLYILSIILWQGYLYYIGFLLNPGIVIGMVSTTLIFLIMEFLGAWYLKQYRHYGDSAFSYMKVRSSYNKYMLAYCTILEFTTDDHSAAKDDMLRVLSESENWPDIKEVNSNDFNYMLQSVEAMGTVFEKLKGVFGRSNSGNPS
ncbi:hypothetical protein AYK59_10485 [Pseudomonas synxantha]|uniref:hypothetical protein n=1 Tax=Pseudomonas synxantha TaxID=47883 RepID=UPI00078C0CAE|nr:hypothetical protein [Pseudomonas synxantha]AMS20538.1 hypothetical protein AYK59_10485 [Pseudomonas synxantha]